MVTVVHLPQEIVTTGLVHWGTIASTGTGLNAGKISLTGLGGNGTNYNHGTYIGNFSKITSVDGAITIAGTGSLSSTGISNIGFVGGGTIKSYGVGTNAAKITLTGTGGAGTNANDGVNTSATITSVDGDISIIGTGSASSTGNTNRGINVSGTIASTGAAQIALTGTGGAGTFSNHGVATSFSTSIASVDGDITIEGTGSTVSTEINNRGVSLQGTIASTGTGTDAANITITGTAGAGTSFNDGVFTNASITSSDGDIAIVGNGSTLSTGSENIGINAEGTIVSTGTGAGAANITLTGTGGAGTSGQSINY